MINLEDLQAGMEQAYNRLSESIGKYRTQAMKVRAHEYDLEGSKLRLYREGKVEGKNQTERDAHIAELLEDDIGWLEKAKQEEADLYMLMELNKLAIEKLRAFLRIAELSQVDNG
jgi:hypothetical protein